MMMTTKRAKVASDKIQAMIDRAFAAVKGRPGWNPSQPDPEMIATRSDAVAALAGIVMEAGLDPVSVLADVLGVQPRKAAIDSSDRTEILLERLGLSGVTPPGRYERGARGSWRSLVCRVLTDSRRAMTAGEIAAEVAVLRGVETGTDRDYRFIERCVGVVLSRYLGQLLDAKNRLVQVGSGGRGRHYVLMAIATGSLKAAA